MGKYGRSLYRPEYVITLVGWVWFLTRLLEKEASFRASLRIHLEGV